MTPDHFAILGLEPRFAIDAADVRRRLVKAAARRHPDRAPDPITAAAWTEELARLQESAGAVLDDISRAEALISLRSGPSPSDDRTLPDGFLEFHANRQHRLEEAVETGDAEGRARLETWARDEWDERRRAVGELLDGDDGHRMESLVLARRELNRWRYAQRMLEQLDPSRREGGA